MLVGLSVFEKLGINKRRLTHKHTYRPFLGPQIWPPLDLSPAKPWMNQSGLDRLSVWPPANERCTICCPTGTCLPSSCHIRNKNNTQYQWSQSHAGDNSDSHMQTTLLTQKVQNDTHFYQSAISVFTLQKSPDRQTGLIPFTYINSGFSRLLLFCHIKVWKHVRCRKWNCVSTEHIWAATTKKRQLLYCRTKTTRLLQ